MDKQKGKALRQIRRRKRVRASVSGTPSRPRLSIYKSLNHMYAQIIDDLSGKTIVSASTRDKGVSMGKTGNAAAAAAIGESIAKKAAGAGIKQVACDRCGFRYHGRVKALADAARKGGLEF